MLAVPKSFSQILLCMSRPFMKFINRYVLLLIFIAIIIAAPTTEYSALSIFELAPHDIIFTVQMFNGGYIIFTMVALGW